ncbi:MAG TPA: serine/threonine-protein kinase [Gemmatimonadales bacterium]
MTDVRGALGEALAGRYVIEGELGRGGMATVFQARAEGRDRSVAIKVMNPNLADALDGKRFVREMAVAASLDHPLIVPLIDSGRAGNVLYYVMPRVDGESLYLRLQRERRLPPPVAIGIARDVASALAYAHGRGVMHRDVKPENILLAGGRALIADFGLARAIGAADYTRLTATGVIVGTVYYMSPEQLREEPDLDQRTDVYSLGCMLYEMLSGEPPYTGRTLSDVASRILRGPVPSVRRLRPEVPDAVDETIARALAKARAERIATMAELLATLPSGI